MLEPQRTLPSTDEEAVQRLRAFIAQGVKRVIEAFALYGLPEPVYEATQGGMAVTVFNQEKSSVDKKTSGGVSGGVSSLYRYIQQYPGNRAVDLANALELSRRTVERWLQQLKTNGKIEFRGASKTGGYHVIDAQDDNP